MHTHMQKYSHAKCGDGGGGFFVLFKVVVNENMSARSPSMNTKDVIVRTSAKLPNYS